MRPSVTVEARRRAPADDLPPQAGFTATKRIGNSVIRNRAKRRLREAARALMPDHAEAGVDYVFVARPGSLAATWDGLLDDVRKALIRLRADLRGAPRRSSSPTESD